MLGVAILVAVIGLAVMAVAAQSVSWFLLPLGAAAAICHVGVHAVAARGPNPAPRLAALSNVLMLAALVFQIDFHAGANCARDALEGAAWRLGWTNELACAWWAGWPSITADLLLYVPVGVTWLMLRPTARRGA